MKVKSLGYIGIESKNFSEWQAYCTDFMGLMDVSDNESELKFRMDDQGWRINVRPGGREDLVFAGFDARDRDTLSEICKQLASIGYEAKRDNTLATERNVRCLYTVEDPDGFQVELYYGASEIAEQNFVSPTGTSGFVTGDQGLGHIVLYTSHEERKYQFYTEGLGFKLSDIITMGGRLDLTFLHCNPRHHTIALASVHDVKHVNHFMVQANLLNDVGYANDRALDLGIKITSTLGCHTNDRMTSFYTQSPSGFDVEYGFGAREVDDNWSVAHHNAPSIWGHRRGG